MFVMIAAGAAGLGTKLAARGVRFRWMIGVMFAVVCRAQTADMNGADADRAPQPTSLPGIFIAGDSTAAGSQGWGGAIAGYFDPTRVRVVNGARGGRSSRTFITDGSWANVINQVKSGDIVLIQFGHNDGGAINEEPPGSTRPLRARGSLPGLGEETQAITNAATQQPEVVRTYGWYLRTMVNETKARGATPILLSLSVRNYWRDGKVERGSGRYGQWTRELARMENVRFIDLTHLVADEFERIGEATTTSLFQPDRVHPNREGADVHARYVVACLKGLRPSPVVKLLSEKGAAVPADTFGWLNLPRPAERDLPSVFLIGDSTVRNGRGDGAGGQWGWGDFLAAFLDPTKINVVNRAVGGLSSRTFLTQGHWQRVLAMIKPGDFVIMQFGHNDNAPLNDAARARGTIKGVGAETAVIDNLLTREKETVYSYGWYLRTYIAAAQEKGATPMVGSLVPRKIWREGKIVRAPGDYAGWARAVAEQTGSPFLDLNERIAVRYEALGVEKVNTLFADEHTHTSAAGAELNAAAVVAALRALPGNPLHAYFREQPDPRAFPGAKSTKED